MEQNRHADMVQCCKCGKVFPSVYGYHLCRGNRMSDEAPFATLVWSNLPLLDEATGRITAKFHAELVDMQDEAIVDAVIKAAEQEEITQLLLLDKRFVLDAIREKMERMRWNG